MINKNKQLLKYVFFGVLNTAITFIIYAILVNIGTPYLISSTFCYVLGILEGFLFNAWFVFNHKLHFSDLTKYSVVYLVAYLINISLLYVVVNYAHTPKIEAQLLVTIVVTLLNFKLVKLLVFRC